MKKILSFFLLTVVVTACGSGSNLTREKLYPEMYDEKPVTLLVMPPINNTTKVEAKEYLYTSISRPLAEAGYYVISPRLSMDVLRQESAYDAELFFDAPLKKFHDFFGADAVIFSVIDRWAKEGVGIHTKIRYVIRSAKTDQVLFDRSCDLFLDLSVNSGSNDKSVLSALIDLTATLLNTALTDNIEAARKANYYIFRDLPAGKYDDLYMKDMDMEADPKDIRKTVK